jgi:hypothetical protein
MSGFDGMALEGLQIHSCILPAHELRSLKRLGISSLLLATNIFVCLSWTSESKPCPTIVMAV